jgi:tetratricopeptide (TPR) repeat protein
MSKDTTEYDFFVSYAHADDKPPASTPDAAGFVTQFVETLLAEHKRFFKDDHRQLTYFFDTASIRSGADWQHTLKHGIAKSRLFLAFISPNYFASDWCKNEWRAWIDSEIAKHILTEGARPVYFVEVPGHNTSADEQQIAAEVAKLCLPPLPAPHTAFIADTAPVIRQVSRRQFIDLVKPFLDEGVAALRRADLKKILSDLARDIDDQASRLARAAASESTVPPYNKNFTGRADELNNLRKHFTDDNCGVVCGIQGLGGVGKTELAFTYAHAFGHAYPGGRFYIPCEGETSLRRALLHLGNFHEIHKEISDEERKHPDTYFDAICRCLDARLATKGHILLVLDNVTDAALVSRAQTDVLTALGAKLHLLATTRLARPPASPSGERWFTLGELPKDDALTLLQKFRPFADEITAPAQHAADRTAATNIVRQLGGFALAVELVGAHLAAHSGSTTYAQHAAELGLQSLEEIATAADAKDAPLRRHDHERRLSAVLTPVLKSLTPAERRTLEYAALLPPDNVALPWLRELVEADFPDAFKPTKLISDPWREHWQKLLRLALFSRADGETTDPNIVRVHRLLQQVEKKDWTEEQRTARQSAIDSLVKRRDAALEKTTKWKTARWELIPLTELAKLWDNPTHPHPGTAWLLNSMGLRWKDLAEWAEAEPLHRRALAILDTSYGSNHPLVATSLNNLALLLCATNRFSEAEPLYRRALEIKETSYGPNHPKVALSLNGLAALLQATNRLSEAEPLYRRALEIHETSYGPNHPKVATSLNNLAELLQATNRLSEAEPPYRRALEINEASYGPNHPSVAASLNNLAELLQATNHLSEAEPLHRRALEIREASYGPNHPDVANSLNNLALLLDATNRLSEAEPLYRRTLEILLNSTRATGHEHPHLQAAFGNYIGLLEELGKTEAQIRAILHEIAPDFVR